MKIVHMEINACADCPYSHLVEFNCHIYDYYECIKTNKKICYEDELTMDYIPDWCPLPDKPETEKEG